MPQKKKIKTSLEDENEASSRATETKSNEESDESLSSSANTDEEGDEDDNQISSEEIQIDFEAREPHQDDFQSIQMMLQQKLATLTSLSSSEIAKLIVNQPNIGNVVFQSTGKEQSEEGENEMPQISLHSRTVRQSENRDAAAAPADADDDDDDDDDMIFGVLSSIALHDAAKGDITAFAAKFKQFLLQECAKHDKLHSTSLSPKLDAILKSKRVCYIVNERFLNIPPAISVPMFESLVKDLASPIGRSLAEVNKPECDYWLFLCKIYSNIQEEDSSASAAAKSSKGRKRQTKLSVQKMYVNPEEEIVDKKSQLTFQVTGGHGKQANEKKSTTEELDLQPEFKVLLLPRECVGEFILEIKNLIK